MHFVHTAHADVKILFILERPQKITAACLFGEKFHKVQFGARVLHFDSKKKINQGSVLWKNKPAFISVQGWNKKCTFIGATTVK